MRVRRGIASGVLAVIWLGGVTANAQETAKPAVATTLDVACVSKYVWRGIPQTQEAAVQPSLTLAHASGLSANFWASQDLDAGETREHDYTLNYTWSGRATMNAGYIYYAFPNTTYASTSELYINTVLPGKLSPSLSLNYDLDEADGFYLALSGGCPIPLGGRKSSAACMNVSARLGFGSADYNKFWFYGTDQAGFSDLYLSAGVPLSMGKTWRVTPSLNYTAVIDGGLRSKLSANGLNPDNFYVGLAASAAF